MKRMLCVMLAVLCLLAAGCSGKAAHEDADPQGMKEPGEPGQTAEAVAPDAETLAAYAAFLEQTVAPLLTEAEGNLNYSPLSVYLALALCAYGAAGETQQELLSLLHLDSAESLIPAAQMLGSDSRGVSTDYSLWMTDEYQGVPVTFRETYLDAARDGFGAELFGADFTDVAGTQARVAAWIAEKTGGVLTDAPELSRDTLLAILNTLYLKDAWYVPFDAENNLDAPFVRADGSEVTATYLRSGSMDDFYVGNGFTRAALRLQFAGSVQFILPDEGVSVAELIEGEGIDALLTGGEAHYGTLTWQVPKFSFGSELDLSTLLKSLGTELAFDAELADFSAMVDYPAYIGRVLQNTHIDLNEEGLEAAAYTAVEMAAGCAEPNEQCDMLLTRPFLYAVVDSDGTVLFIGVVGDPTR